MRRLDSRRDDTMGRSFNGRTIALQAVYAGSIPVRSTMVPGVSSTLRFSRRGRGFKSSGSTMLR